MRVRSLPVAISLCISSVLARSAQVYLYPSNDLQHEPVQPNEANILLAHHLGFPILEEATNESVDRWNRLFHAVQKGGSVFSEGEQTSVMMLVQSDHPKDFMPPSTEPSLLILDSPTADDFTQLMQSYIGKAYNIFGSVFSSLEGKDARSPGSKSILDLFDISSQASQEFVEELDAMVGFVDNQLEGKASGNEGQFAAFEMKGLAKLEQEHGRESALYLTAAKSVHAVLSSPSLQASKVAVIIVSPDSHSRRGVTPARDFPNRNRAVHSVSTCFASNATCAESTDNCSGHGSCDKVTIAGKSCFTCTCSVTKNQKGRKEWWAGAACEKKDLSSPFTLLVGTTIFLILLVAFSVWLLSSVGYEPLPNTLTASAVPHGAKRD